MLLDDSFREAGQILLFSIVNRYDLFDQFSTIYLIS